MDWLDLLAVQGTLKSILQHHSSKASILWCSAFFTVQLSHPYMTTGKTTALTRQSTGEGNGKSLQYSCLENPMNRWKGKKDRTLKDELPRLVGAQYATGDQWRNNSRKSKEMEPKQKQHPVLDVIGDRSKVWCCKQQYSIGTWNVMSMNQDKLEVVKQEMARVNTDILGTSEHRTGMGWI